MTQSLDWTWTQRAQVSRTDVAVIRKYRSRDGRYAVSEVHSTLGLGTHWLAIAILPNGGEVVLGRHKTKSAAQDRCHQEL